jgi:hypothetical protein
VGGIPSKKKVTSGDGHGHLQITRLDQLNQPGYSEFQTFRLFVVVNLTRGQHLGHHACPTSWYTLALFLFLNVDRCMLHT